MTNSAVRIEYLKGKRSADFYSDAVPNVLQAEVLSVGAASVTGSVIPHQQGTAWSEARVTVIGTPVIVVLGDHDTVEATQTNGARLPEGLSFVTLKAGLAFAFIQATDAPT